MSQKQQITEMLQRLQVTARVMGIYLSTLQKYISNYNNFDGALIGYRPLSLDLKYFPKNERYRLLDLTRNSVYNFKTIEEVEDKVYELLSEVM